MNTVTLMSGFLASLLAILNPLGLLPVFIGFTKNNSRQAQQFVSLLVALAIFGMMRGEAATEIEQVAEREFRDSREEAKSRFGQIVIPVVVPLFVGPGTISTVILLRQPSRGCSDTTGISRCLRYCGGGRSHLSALRPMDQQGPG